MSGFEEIVGNDFDKANEFSVDENMKLKEEIKLLKKSRSEIIECSAGWQDKWEKSQAEVDRLRAQLKDKDHTIKVFTERYNNDCILINQLNTTIDILADKYAKLRDIKGL